MPQDGAFAVRAGRSDERATGPGGCVLVIGAGGLGCAAVLALAAAGVRRIGVVDDDRVDATKLHRPLLHGAASIGELKVSSLARGLRDRFPAASIEGHAVRFDA